MTARTIAMTGFISMIVGSVLIFSQSEGLPRLGAMLIVGGIFVATAGTLLALIDSYRQE